MLMDMPITTDNDLQLIDNQTNVAIHEQVSIIPFDTRTISSTNITIFRKPNPQIAVIAD